MKFEQFQASRKWVDDVADVIGIGADEPQPGFVYAGDLHIFGMGGGAAPDEYLLVIGNSQKVSADLDALERDLYQFGCDEGILTSDGGEELPNCVWRDAETPFADNH